MVKRLMVCAAMTVGFAGPLAVADSLKDAATKVTECRAITDDLARLSCLDAASLALSEVLESGAAIVAETPTPEAPVADPEADKPKWAQAPEPRKVEEPKITADGQKVEEKKPPIWARVLRPDDGSDDDLYPVTVVRITKNSAGRFFFYTDTGEVWRQTQVKDVRPPSSLPASAVVQKSLAGNPRISFDEVSSRSYKVRRVE